MVSAGKAKPCSEQIDRSLRYTQTRKMRPAAAIETRRNPNAAAWPEASRAGNLTTGGQSEFVQDGLPGHAPEAAKTPKVRTERAARLLAQEPDSKTERHTVPDEDRRQQQNQRREKWILAHAA
jgi:hypothetical protein